MARFEVLFAAVALVSSCHGMQSIMNAITGANQTQFVTVLEKALDQNLLDLTTGGRSKITVYLSLPSAISTETGGGRMLSIFGGGGDFFVACD